MRERLSWWRRMAGHPVARAWAWPATASLVLAVSASAQQSPARDGPPPVATPVSAPIAAPQTRWIDSIFAPYTVADAPGCAVGVARAGVTQLAKGYGAADIASRRAVDAETPFYVASLAKQFTAMSIVLIAQDGRLSLDDSIRRWVPEVPAFGAAITLRELLQHTSGLRDYLTLLGLSGWSTDGLLSEAELLELIHHQKTLNFLPGDEFLYSNTGYALLGLVVQRASGQPLRDFAAARIFAPLGMTHTHFRDDHRSPVPNAARGYQPDGAGYRISEPQLDVVGDGGLYSTAADLLKWNDNFITGRVGGAAGVALLEQPGHLNDGEPIPYGLGLTIGRYHGHRQLAHSGVYAGYRAAMLRFPDDSVAVVTLCNNGAADVESLADAVADVELGLTARPVSAAATIDLSISPMLAGGSPLRRDSSEARRRSDALAELTGDYYSDELELPVSLVPENGVLVLRRPHADDLRFIPSTSDLYMTHDQVLLRVLRGERGAVVGFSLTMGRVRDLEFDRRRQ